VTGTRALEMAESLGDVRLRIFTSSYLEQAQYYRGEYARVVELATDALAALPADWVYEHFGMVAPASVYARSWLVISLAELGRFGEAAAHAAEAIRLAEATQQAYSIGLAYRAAGTFHLLSSQPGAAAHALHLLGDIATHPERFDAASGEAHYGQELALAEPRGMRPLQAHCHRGLGTLYATIGQQEQARAELSAAIGLYRAMDMTFWLSQVEATLSQVEGQYRSMAKLVEVRALRQRKTGEPLGGSRGHSAGRRNLPLGISLHC
jgi:tetratricopeptide (TPR) repeat protein